MVRPRHARDSLRAPFEGWPALGAVHSIVPTGELHRFLGRVADIAEQVITGRDLTPGGESSPANCEFDQRRYITIYNPERMGVTVFPMDPNADQARKVRAVWQQHDLGAVKQEAQNEIGRVMPQGMSPRLRFNGVMSVGGRMPNDTSVRQKLALVPTGESFSETIELLGTESAIIGDALRRRLKQFAGPGDVTPHLPFMAFRPATSAEQIQAITADTHSHVLSHPLSLGLGRLEFRDRTARS